MKYCDICQDRICTKNVGVVLRESMKGDLIGNDCFKEENMKKLGLSVDEISVRAE